LVLVNPWVRTEQGEARVQLRHYYLRRLFQASLWQKVLRGEFRFREAAAAFWKSIVSAMRRGTASHSMQELPTDEALPARMEAALSRFQGRVLLILSGNDLTAQEFKDVAGGSSRWRGLLEGDRITRCDLPEANHTFARRDWRDQVARWTEAWVQSR
jgi:hypothetical protein